jgi:DNA-binding NtrC family response regulator
MVMPGQISGHEMIESLVAQRPDLKVLLMSGYAEQLLQSPTSQNYSHFIQNPFAPAALLQKVLEVLNHPSG